MKRTVLYIDDEKKRVEKVTKIIRNTLEHVELIQIASLHEAYKVLLERTVDIFVINLVMSSEDVTDTEELRLIARIREIPKYTLTPVIVISSLYDPQLYIYEELNCLGCLGKTFAEERLVKLLKTASFFETQRTAERTVVFRRNRILYPVLVKDIVYMEKKNGIAMIYMEDGTILDVPYVNFSKLMYDLVDSGLFFCNRSTIVNRKYVYAVDPTSRYIVLKNKMGEIDIGVTYKNSVLGEFTNKYGAFVGRTNEKYERKKSIKVRYE